VGATSLGVARFAAVSGSAGALIIIEPALRDAPAAATLRRMCLRRACATL
jgi:hypothetical protein